MISLKYNSILLLIQPSNDSTDSIGKYAKLGCKLLYESEFGAA